MDYKGFDTMEQPLTEEQKHNLREFIILQCGKCIGILYKFGAKWTDFSKLPEALDCSGLDKGVYAMVGLKLPDGSQAQFNETIVTTTPKIGDLCFFGHEKDITKIYHCGVVYDNENIIEAREFNPKASFETGKVILRPRAKWENYKNFVGYRVHSKLV